MDGKPVPAAGVMIVAEGGKEAAAMGMTDPLGKFQIITRFGESEQIPPGKYKILVESPGPVVVPPIYKDMARTPLSVTLPHHGELEIVLKK